MKYQNVQFIAYRVDTISKTGKGTLKGFEIADMNTLLPVYEHLQHYTGVEDDTTDIPFGALSWNWAPDSAATTCHACKTEYGIMTRPHHCRVCGRVFCDD